MLERLKQWAKQLKSRLTALWLCSRHPRTPLAAKILCVAIVAYAISPIDLIPDFIPVLGYLDDVILLPLGIWLVWRMIPGDVMAECVAAAQQRIADPAAFRWGRVAAVIAVLAWIALAWLAWMWWQRLGN